MAAATRPQTAGRSPRELVVEARARPATRAAGFVARKSRWRRDSIDNYGGFMIVDPSTNFAVAGFRYDYAAEAVIDWCCQEKRSASQAACGRLCCWAPRADTAEFRA
jgi:hypothetical protein